MGAQQQAAQALDSTPQHALTASTPSNLPLQLNKENTGLKAELKELRRSASACTTQLATCTNKLAEALERVRAAAGCRIDRGRASCWLPNPGRVQWLTGTRPGP